MAKRRPVIPGARGLYNMVAKRRTEIVNKLFELMDDSNTNVALGASKCLAGKILPDLKATDLKIDGKMQTGVIVLPSLKTHKKKMIQSDTDAGTEEVHVI